MESGTQRANLRHLLNRWDPIGVADVVEAEYDRLLAPLWTWLTSGRSRAALSDHLWIGIEGHFGLDPVRRGTAQVAERLLARTAGRAPSSRSRLALPSRIGTFDAG